MRTTLWKRLLRMLQRKPQFFQEIISNPYFHKTLRKAILKRSQLNNKANKMKCKQQHFDSLNSLLDSKPFWKSRKPHFSNKHSFGDSKYPSNENGEILTENIKIAKTFNSYFKLVTDSLELFDSPLQSNISLLEKIVQNIVKNFFQTSQYY